MSSALPLLRAGLCPKTSVPCDKAQDVGQAVPDAANPLSQAQPDLHFFGQSPKECEKPLKTGAFRDSKSGTRTRDPRLMKPVPTGQTVEANVYGGLDLGYSGQHGSLTSGAESGAVGARERLGGARDSGLERLAELWPMLSELDRLALVDHAEHLVALRGGGEAVAGLDCGDASESRLSASDCSGQATARPAADAVLMTGRLFADRFRKRFYLPFVNNQKRLPCH